MNDNRKEVVEKINNIRESLNAIEREMNYIKGQLFDMNFEIVIKNN